MGRLLPWKMWRPHLRGFILVRVSAALWKKGIILPILVILLLPDFGIGKDILPQLSAPPEGTDRAPIHVTADQLEYRDGIYHAQGSVVVIQGPMKISADAVFLNNETGKLHAIGNVHVTDKESQMNAAEMTLDVDTKLGVLYNGRLFIKQENYHVYGTEIERRELDDYLFRDASFTACDCPEDPDWRIRSRQIRLHLDQNIVARDVVFYVGNVPIVYLPYFTYPMKRQTGLLVPRFGYSTRHGFKINQPFFWAISQHQDATLSFDHQGGKGDGVEIEYRYVQSKDLQGTLETDYFYDEEKRVARWDVRYNHKQRLSEQVDARLDIRYINQRNNFLELSEQTSERAQQNLESNLFVAYRGDLFLAYALARYTLDLTTPNNNNTLQRLPELGMSLIEYRLGASPLYLNFDGSAVNFWRETGFSTQRVDLYPKISWPIPLSDFATVTPWAGFRKTWYSRGNLETHPLDRDILPIGFHLNTRYDRMWGTMTHLIRPSLMYEHIDVGRQPDVLQFDDLDRLFDRQSVTVSLTQRLLEDNGDGPLIEKVFSQLTESYNIHKDDSGATSTGERPYSDLRWELKVKPTSFFSMEVDSFYNLDRHALSSLNTDLNFNLRSYATASFGQRYTKAGSISKKGDLFNPMYLGDRETASPVQFLTEKVVIKTPWGVHLASRAYYDVRQGKLVEIAYGLQFESQCWNITVTYLDLKERNDLYLMVNLKGLGGLTSRKWASLF